MKIFNNCFAATAVGGKVVMAGGFGHTVQLSNDNRSMFSFLISIRTGAAWTSRKEPIKIDHRRPAQEAPLAAAIQTRSHRSRGQRTFSSIRHPHVSWFLRINRKEKWNKVFTTKNVSDGQPCRMVTGLEEMFESLSKKLVEMNWAPWLAKSLTNQSTGLTVKSVGQPRCRW